MSGAFTGLAGGSGVDPGQVPGREPGLDRVLPVSQPVHRGVDVIGGHVRAERAVRSRHLGLPPARYRKYIY